MFVTHLVLSTVKGIMVKAAIARAEAPISRAFQVVVFIIIVVVKKMIHDGEEQRLILKRSQSPMFQYDAMMIL